MNIALIAHNKKKEDLINFVKNNKDVFSKHKLYGTGTTGQLIIDNVGLEVTRKKSGPLGGDQEIGSMVANGKLDMVIFFRDPLNPKPHEPNDNDLLRLCDVHNIPFATNIATAEALIRGVERGDFEWREIVNPRYNQK